MPRSIPPLKFNRPLVGVVHAHLQPLEAGVPEDRGADLPARHRAEIAARVIGVDIVADKLAWARSCGAEIVINARETTDVAGAIRELTGGGAHLSIDALGSPATCRNSILSLRKRGRHIQVGLLLADQSEPPLPMSHVIARELDIRGSHGLQAREYAGMLESITTGRLAF